MRVWAWIVVFVVVLIGVFSGIDHWKRLELARRECAESRMPNQDLENCIKAKWLFRRLGTAERTTSP
jgi:hypothetical protein